jgi:hypothetical protein
VPTCSIFRNYKENWNSTKISVTTAMHLTRRGSVQSPLTSGLRGWAGGQTPWPAGPTLQPLTGFLHGHTLHEAVTRNLKLEVSGSQTRWLADHMARLTGQHLMCYLINQVSNSSFDPYKYPLLMEFKTPHSTCSSPLVKVPV